MEYITLTSLRILWNGEPSERITPSRGIRQGDPLSLYIFVLCLERLSQLINLRVDNREWNPIKISKNNPNISHLLFTDDMLLFAEASEEQVQVIMDCLNCFCIHSGKKVNMAKTKLFFSKTLMKESEEPYAI